MPHSGQARKSAAGFAPAVPTGKRSSCEPAPRNGRAACRKNNRMDLVEWTGRVPSSGEKRPSRERDPPSFRGRSIKLGVRTAAKPAAQRGRCPSRERSGEIRLEQRWQPGSNRLWSGGPPMPCRVRGPIATMTQAFVARAPAPRLSARPGKPTCPLHPADQDAGCDADLRRHGPDGHFSPLSARLPAGATSYRWREASTDPTPNKPQAMGGALGHVLRPWHSAERGPSSGHRADHDDVQEARPVRAADVAALDVGRAAGAGDQVDVARRRAGAPPAA